MDEITPRYPPQPAGGGGPMMTGPRPGMAAQGSLVDILDRVLDKGLVIAGDVAVNLLDIELLTIKVRLVIASVDKAKEMGIDWWESDAALTGGDARELADENRDLRERLRRLEERLGLEQPEDTRRDG